MYESERHKPKRALLDKLASLMRRVYRENNDECVRSIAVVLESVFSGDAKYRVLYKTWNLQVKTEGGQWIAISDTKGVLR